MNLHLFRAESTLDGVFGRLTVPNGGVLHSLEDDWLDNRPGESCIPAGEYILRRTVYRKRGYETFEVCDVPFRERILIHPGNTEEDVGGCIALGTRRGWLLVPDEDSEDSRVTEKRSVVESRRAFRQFMDWMGPFDNATLTVEWAPGLP